MGIIPGTLDAMSAAGSRDSAAQSRFRGHDVVPQPRGPRRGPRFPRLRAGARRRAVAKLGHSIYPYPTHGAAGPVAGGPPDRRGAAPDLGIIG